MKWKNCDINVVEQENISNFSKLDYVVTPLRLLELFFDDVLADAIVGYTKLYSHRKKADISLEMKMKNERLYTNEKVLLFLSMLLLSGCHELPDRKMYSETTPDSSSVQTT